MYYGVDMNKPTENVLIKIPMDKYCCVGINAVGDTLKLAAASSKSNGDGPTIVRDVKRGERKRLIMYISEVDA